MAVGFVRDEESPEETDTPEVRHGEAIPDKPAPAIVFTADQVIALLEAALKAAPES